MVKQLIEEGFGTEEREDYSCSEKILYGANQVYRLGLDKQSLVMAAGLSGGVYTGKLCGAVSASALVLSRLYVKDRAHAEPRCGELVEEFVTRFEGALGTTSCGALKEKYRTEEEGCKAIVFRAAEILDDIIAREGR